MSEVKRFHELHPTPSLALLDSFTQPPPTWTGFTEKLHGRPYETAVVIGRFQLLHFGHVYLFHKALELADNIIIGIGSSNVINKNNPFTALQRHLAIERTLTREGLRERVKNIIHIKDHKDDSDEWDDPKWLEEVLSKSGNTPVVIGNNQHVNGVYRKAGLKAVEITEFDRGKYRGTNLRARLEAEGYFRNLPSD